MADLGMPGGGLGGLSNINWNAILKAILIVSGILSIVFGLMLASRYFGFPLFFDLTFSDGFLIKITSIVAIITGTFTLVREIKGGLGGGLGNI